MHVTAPQPLRWAPLEGEGELQFETASLRRWLAAQGVRLPPMRDPTVPGATSVATRWKFNESKTELSALQLRLDDTHLQGRIAGRRQEPRDWQVELQGDALDADRYRRPDSDPGEPFSLPVEALRALPVNGSVKLQRLSGGGVVARDAVIELRSGARR
jgi:AsmA protein